MTVGGFYARDGSYVPGHCAYTNPTTPGQLYPSGAQPVPSTNPAQGASRLPGQLTASGLLPINSSDLGPAPSYVNAAPLQGGSVESIAPSVGPGTPLNATNATGTLTLMQPAAVATGAAGLGTADATTPANSLLPGQAAVNSTAATTAGMADQFPQTGLPALNGNRAVPSSLTTVGTTPGLVSGTGTATSTAVTSGANLNAVSGTTGATTGPAGTVAGAGTPAVGTNLSLMNTAYGVSLGAAPPRPEQIYTGQEIDTVTIAYPNQ